jgi:hypothetical protein
MLQFIVFKHHFQYISSSVLNETTFVGDLVA